MLRERSLDRIVPYGLAQEFRKSHDEVLVRNRLV